MSQDLVGRVQRLLTNPKAEWDAIDGESVEPQSLITGYVAPLAAIPAIASIIGLSMVGVAGFKIGLGTAFAGAIVSFVMAIVMVFVLAFVINTLAPSFGAEKNFKQALKVSVFAPTAAWVAGVFAIIPMLGILALVGAVYSLYLLFVGLPKMMKPPEDKATVYTIVSIVAAIIAMIVVNFIAAAVTPGNQGAGAYSSITTPTGERVATSKMEERAKAMEKAAESGDVGAIFSAIAGEDAVDIVDADALGALAPMKIAGLTRQSLDVETLAVPVKAVVMTARYGEPGQDGARKTMELRVTNSSMIAGVMGMAGFTGGGYNRSSNDGYERLKRDGDQMVIEEWSKSSKHAKYGRSVEGGFLIEAEGYGFDMKAVKRAAEEISERKLKKLPKAG